MATTLPVPKRLSNVHLINCNEDVNPSYKTEHKKDLSTIKLNIEKLNNYNTSKNGARGSEILQTYTSVNKGILLYKKGDACQNDFKTDEMHANKNLHGVSVPNKHSYTIIDGKELNLSNKDGCSTLERRDRSESDYPRQTKTKIVENRQILSEIRVNKEAEEYVKVEKDWLQDCANDTCNKKVVKTESNKYKKLQKRNDNSSLPSDEKEGLASNIRKYRSAIPKPKGSFNYSNDKIKSKCLESKSGNKYQRPLSSTNENKLLNNIEGQEIQPSYVISSKNNIPVHKNTGKNHIGGLNVIDKIGRTDKTIQLNKGDVQNQRCGTINKYCRNTCVNEPVTINSRLSKKGSLRTSVVTNNIGDDEADSFNSDNICLTLRNVESNDVTRSTSIEECKPNGDIICGDFNANLNKDLIRDRIVVSPHLLLGDKEGRNKLELSDEFCNCTLSDQKSTLRHSQKSPLSCQYKFNNFTCTKNTLDGNKSNSLIFTNEKNEGKSHVKLSLNGNENIDEESLKLNSKCVSRNYLNNKKTEVSSTFMKLQKTGNDGTMNNSVKIKTNKSLNRSVTKQISNNDNIERILTSEQVKPTGKVLNSAKNSNFTQRFKSKAERSDITPQRKVIKKDDQVKEISKPNAPKYYNTKYTQDKKLKQSAKASSSTSVRTSISHESKNRNDIKMAKPQGRATEKATMSKSKNVGLTTGPRDKKLSGNTTSKTVCQILPERKSCYDNRQSSDKEITNEVNEICSSAKDTSIDNDQERSDDIKTFTKNKTLRDNLKSHRFHSASIDLIEGIKQDESEKSVSRGKTWKENDRLHNINITCCSNSGEIDHIADGQDGIADDQKVQHTTGKQLTQKFNLNRKCAKEINDNDGASSAITPVCLSNQLENKCQNNYFGSLSSAENENSEISQKGFMGNTNLPAEDIKCGISSLLPSICDSDVPKTIINDNIMMGYDMQCTKTARDPCQGINAYIGNNNQKLNILDFQCEFYNKDSNDSLNLDSNVHNGISQSLTSTDDSNYDISLPLSDNNLICTAKDTLLCNTNNSVIMDKQKEHSSISDQYDNKYEKEKSEIENEQVVEKDKSTSIKRNKLLSPKISAKKFHTSKDKEEKKSNKLSEKEKSEKEKVNLLNNKCKNQRSRPIASYDQNLSSHRGAIPGCKTTRRNDKVGTTSPTAKREIKRIPLKASSPCSDISSPVSDNGIRIKTKTKSAIMSEQSTKPKENSSIQEKVEDFTDTTIKTPVGECQSEKSIKRLSSVKITATKHTLNCDQVPENKKAIKQTSDDTNKPVNNISRDKNERITEDGCSAKMTLKRSIRSTENDNKSTSNIPIKPQAKSTITTLNRGSKLHSSTSKSISRPDQLLNENSVKDRSSPSLNSKIVHTESIHNSKGKILRTPSSGLLPCSGASKLNSTSKSSDSVKKGTLEVRKSAKSDVNIRSKIPSRPLNTKTSQIKTSVSKTNKIQRTENKTGTDSSRSSRASSIASPILDRKADNIAPSVKKKISTVPPKSRQTTPSPSLSSNSRASSVVSLVSSRKSSNSNISVKTSSSVSKTNKTQTFTSVPRPRLSSTKGAYEPKIGSGKSKLKPGINSEKQSLQTKTISTIPRTKIAKPTSTCKSSRLQKPKIVSNLSKQTINHRKSNSRSEDEKPENVNRNMNTDDEHLCLMPFTTEDLIRVRTSDINEEISKTASLSDKPDQISPTDQIKDESFEISQTENANINIKSYVGEQVQDPSIEITTKPHNITIAPMDKIHIESEVYSSNESVCSEQYWSASDGEINQKDLSNDHASLKNNIADVDSDNNKMDKISNLHEKYEESCEKMSNTVINETCETSTDNQEQTFLQSEEQTHSLHNDIDSNCTTEENISENTAFDLMIENISQRLKPDSNTSEQAINTFLMLDSRDFDKAQYVSTDYEENITPISNLEQHFNAGNDNLSKDINEVNLCKSDSKYSTDIEENAVEELYVKPEKLSETNMEHLIDENISTELELLQQTGSSNISILKTEKNSNDCIEPIETVVNIVHVASENHDPRRESRNEGKDDNESFIDDSNAIINQKGYDLGELVKLDGTETCDVKPSSIPGNRQFETNTFNHIEEVSSPKDNLNYVEINTDFDRIESNQILEEKSNDIIASFILLNSNGPQENNSATSYEENQIFESSDFKSENVGDRKNDGEFNSHLDQYLSTESDFSDSSSMASSVQNSPSGSRRPRRFFSRAERKQKYEQLKPKSLKYNGKDFESLSKLTKDEQIVNSDNHLREVNENKNSVGNQTLPPKNIIKENQSLQTVTMGEMNVKDSERLNSKDRCEESSRMIGNMDHIPYNTDDRSNAYGEQKHCDEESLTDVKSNAHDIILSHSQSQETDLCLSDEKLLSSVKHSEELDAEQDVVKRAISTSGLSENRRAINLEKLFHSEDGFSVSVECTLQLNTEEEKCETECDISGYVPEITAQEAGSKYALETSSDVSVEGTFDLLNDVHANDKQTIEAGSQNLETVSTDFFDLMTNAENNEQSKNMFSTENNKNVQIYSTIVHAESRQESLISTTDSKNHQHQLQEHSIKKDVCETKIKESENDVEQRLLNSNKSDKELKSNNVSDNKAFTSHHAHLNVSNSAFSEVHEKTVICTVNKAIPNSYVDDKTKDSGDEASKNDVENNRSLADRKHMTLNFTTDEKKNNEMGLTTNSKVTHKIRSRQNVRRFTDTIKYSEAEMGSLALPLKARTRSKSPIGCTHSPNMESDQSPLVNRKVSEICRTFIKKTSTSTVTSPGSPAENVLSVRPKSPSGSRHMKWARVEGVWQRIPADDDNANNSEVIHRKTEIKTPKSNRKSNETLSQWKHLVDKIQKIQKEKQENEIENSSDVTITQLPDNNEQIKTVNDKPKTNVSPIASFMTTGKPKPPKVLPKPKRPRNNSASMFNELSVNRSESVNGSHHISTLNDNEHGEVLSLTESNQTILKNKSKQVQDIVENNNVHSETMCSHDSGDLENKHEKPINYIEEIKHEQEIAISNNSDISTKLTKSEEILAESEKEQCKMYEASSSDSMQVNREATKDQQLKTTIQTFVCEDVSTQNQLSNVNLSQEELSSASKTKSAPTSDISQEIKKNKVELSTNTNTKYKTVPIKQEMYPKEEDDDISSDIIAKVLKVMDSFTQKDSSGENSNSGIQFDDGNLYNDMNERTTMCMDKYGHFSSKGGDLAYGQRQQQLLSEISELEERNNEDILEDKNKNVRNVKQIDNSHGSSLSPVQNNNNGNLSPQKSFPRSHSLPTTALSHPGSRILYRDGTFVIEPDFPEEVEDNIDTHSLDIENGNVETRNTMGRDLRTKNRNSYSKCKRSQSEADLFDVDCEENLFLQNDGNLTVIENESYLGSSDNLTQKQTELHYEEKSNTRPSSLEESQILGTGSDKKPKLRVKLKGKTRFSARRSKSFKDFSDTEKPTVTLRRNLSFVEALNDKEQLSESNKNGSMQSLNSTISVEEFQSSDRKMSLDDRRSKNQGFLQKVFSRRKTSLDVGGKKDSILSKMSHMKTFFGSRKKKDHISEKVVCAEPQTPPIAAFQSDNDIHIIDSAPGSPYSSRFKRRHTSAEIYDQNSNTNSASRSSLDILSNRSNRPYRLDDQMSIKSFNSSSLSISEQPLRPKSPKPNVTIVRRNSNLSLPSSPINEVIFDMGGKIIDVHRNHDSVYSGKTISLNNSNNGHPSSVHVPLRKSSKQLSGVDLEKLASLVQNDMTSSNSNDSGIQHDVSVHSSNESIKASADGSNVARRRKSPSPRPERPKSEISVRWADLVETTDISPVKRREGGDHRPRPRSDLGGSSLSSDMKPFGSQSSLQLMYSSLQSLHSLQKHDPLEQKNSKRRMSTPHPIKTRLSTRVPPKQQKRVSLVRSHSMPESLDKLHRRRKLHSAIGSSNLQDFYLRNFDDDSSSDEGSDISVDHISLNEKSLSARSSRAQLSTLDEMPESETRVFAEALWDHITMDSEELRFRHGDLIEIIDMSDKDWWYGALDDHEEGWLPATFVRLRVNQENFEEDFISRFSEIPEHSSPNLRRISMINTDQGRTNVIKEILQAEQDYVKHMKDVVEGYIRHARKRVDMFTEEKISVIFGNIEEIFKFSTQFLETLESAYCKDEPHQSELGKCFLKHSKSFEIYSDYCNNHPSGSSELKDLYRKQKYRHFFEACRLLQEMIEIPLEGFLLNPVQKICKYPLQLAELLKYTPPSHPDYESVQHALEAMKKIAALINERKRKMESIEKLARWQHTVEDWQGTDLLEKSSELIYSSELSKINSAGWSQERWFYLFDHQLIYCKKDLLKRNGYSYKGRIDTDHCEVVDIEDGKDLQYNVTVKNAWKLHETNKDKWYLLYAKTQAEKQRWIKAFQKERERVREDQENNFIPDHWKKTILSRIKASHERERSRAVSDIQYKQEFIRGIPSHATLPRSYSKKQAKQKKGWFPFGGKLKSKS